VKIGNEVFPGFCFGLAFEPEHPGIQEALHLQARAAGADVARLKNGIFGKPVGNIDHKMPESFAASAATPLT